MTQTHSPTDHSLAATPTVPQSQRTGYMGRFLNLLPGLLVFFMICSLVFLNAVMPLRGVWFYDSLVPQLGSWTLLPTRILFPHAQLIYGNDRMVMPIASGTTWKEDGLLFGAFTLLFLLYLLAVYVLPSRISRRFILLSTAIFGLILVFCPVVGSQDVFTYIAYARMAVVYHLNPLTTVPAQISHDPVYSNIYWVNQPSIYGPVWTLITCILQEISLLVFGAKQLLPMVLLMRLLDLGLHLGSVQLVWSIIGKMQDRDVFSSLRGKTRRQLATLAFAWNPVLLFEACVNAHSDTAVLFLLLAALWFLLSRPQQTYATITGAAIFFALGICLKINYVLLLPGILLFLWMQYPQDARLKRFSRVALACVVCGIVCLLLYIPFWGHGEIIHVISVNPNTVHEANSLYEVAIRVYAQRTGASISPASGLVGSPLENFAHTSSYILFFIVYAVLCIRALFAPDTMRTPSGLLRWLALVWLFYCLLGTPWFWPWYSVTFFGLFALIETDRATKETIVSSPLLSLTARVLAFTMVSVYCFYTWAPHFGFVRHVFHIQFLYLRGLWLWLLPGVVLCAGLLLQSKLSRSFVLSRFSALPGIKRIPGFQE